jgi:hypothetical protein
MGKASVAKEVSDKRTWQIHRGRDDSMHGRNAQEARETEDDSGWQTATDNPRGPGPVARGGGEARRSEEAG